MAQDRTANLTDCLRRAVLAVGKSDLTDGQLLEDYLRRRDEAAVAALVRRHGPMVWGVCRRVLHNHHDAEDAFQATFLVLVRKAASVMPREMVGNWLYGVAHQTALKARATAGKRRARERQVMEMPEPAATPGPDPRDSLEPLLDQELSRLPDRYRVAVVLCDLEGKTRKEAARQLKIPEGTLSTRLRTARALLARRLARHGLSVSVGVLAAVLSQEAASAWVPTAVVYSTIRAASLFAAGQTAAAGACSLKAAALTEGVLKAMLLTKLKAATAGLLLLAAVIGGAGLIYRTAAADPPKERPAGGQRQASKAEAANKGKSSNDDLDRLQGTWRLVTSELDGITIGEGRPEIKDTRLVIDRSSVTMTGKLILGPEVKKDPEDVKAVGTLELDAGKNPRQIVITWKTNPWLGREDLVQRGIYSLEGDRLKLCFYFPGKDTRPLVPTEFSANAGSKRSLGTWKRVPPSEQGDEKKPDAGAP